MKSVILAVLVSISAVAAGTVTASADTFTIHGAFGGNAYGGR